MTSKKKLNKEMRGRRFKKQGGQSGGQGYNEHMVGRAHDSNEGR